MFVRRDDHVPPLQPLYDVPYTVIRLSLHHFTLRISDKEDKVSTLRLKLCTDPTVPSVLPRVRGRPPAAARAAAAHRVHFTRSNQQNRAGNRFPLARRQGFCTPRRHSRQHRRSARPQPPSTVQIRPLGLRHRGLGGAL